MQDPPCRTSRVLSRSRADLAAEFRERHWKEWLDTPVPALDGETLRKASTTVKGRECLAALIDDFEWHSASPDVPVAHLRSELGL